ncbi:proline racemase family protein [Arhodomonas sp. AD133]|uniref:proline racemase family protein n=1 Tax=Arhodomonas sp. AD133 TaxID=3415009 RepID=UPI003EC06E41
MNEEPHYRVVDMHTAGEPVRIFTGGVPQLAGATLLERRRDAMTRHDHVRRRLMHEPRGHADMYGVWPTAPVHPDAAMAVLFTHNEGYSTMCGHATIALGRYVVDQGLVTLVDGRASFVLECPCGPVTVHVTADGDGRPGEVAFDSVPAFASRLDAPLDLPGMGRVSVDVAYGGAFYAILPASRLGLDLADSPYESLVQAARQVTAAAREQLTVRHPDEPDLGFLYGTILTDNVPPEQSQASANVCVFGGGQVDRSPTGSGVTARLALANARGALTIGAERRFRGVSGVEFRGRIARVTDDGSVVVTVAGRSHYVGETRFVVEANDPLADGLAIPATLGELWR